MQNVLQANLGFTEDQLRKYYSNHKADFYAPSTKDSAGKSKTVTVLSPFEEVKNSIADKMFVAVHKPDSAFIAMLPARDSATVNREWLRMVREQGNRDYFMKLFYKETCGSPLPDSLKDFCGKGKLISPDDLDIILGWLPAERRTEFKSNPPALRDLALWLVRWKLFSQKATDLGFAKEPQVRNVLKWAWHFEVAQRYIISAMADQAKKGIAIDSSMVSYSYRDETSTVNPPDTAQLKSHFTTLMGREVNVKMDSMVYELRKNEKIRFLKPEWSDDLQKDPAKILRTADSLRDTGNTSEAQIAYSTLVDNFFFTKEGKKALLERAKIKTEQQLYTDAVKDYRRSLLLGTDKARNCNTMFMIGFIYDEYLNNPEMAELNYKWVLKNTPECELVDDAEFMMLHLGEQMASVDELQAEVKRQGKKVEEGTPADSGLKVEMGQAKQKKI